MAFTPRLLFCRVEGSLRKGWEGMGALRKTNASPCHFQGLVTGVGAGGLWRAGKPEKGQTLALTEAGHSQGRPPPRGRKRAVKGRDAPGKSAGAETRTTWSDPAAVAPRETGHFWG